MSSRIRPVPSTQVKRTSPTLPGKDKTRYWNRKARRSVAPAVRVAGKVRVITIV